MTGLAIAIGIWLGIKAAEYEDSRRRKRDIDTLPTTSPLSTGAWSKQIFIGIKNESNQD